MVTHGAEVNVQSTCGWEPLHYLVSWNLLVSWNRLAGFNPNQVQAIRQVIGYLIEHGADVNSTSAGDDNQTPLFKAVSAGNIPGLLELLKAPELILLLREI